MFPALSRGAFPEPASPGSPAAVRAAAEQELPAEHVLIVAQVSTEVPQVNRRNRCGGCRRRWWWDERRDEHGKPLPGRVVQLVEDRVQHLLRQGRWCHVRLGAPLRNS